MKIIIEVRGEDAAGEITPYRQVSAPSWVKVALLDGCNPTVRITYEDKSFLEYRLRRVE